MALTQEDLQAIGALLEPIKNRLEGLEQGQAAMQADIAGLKQGQQQIREDIADLKIDVIMLWKESAIVDNRIAKHEKEYHSA